MKCKLNVGNLEFEIEGTDRKEIFKSIGEIQETFGQKQCGACNSPDIKYVMRTVDDNNYYELHCQKCRCKLEFGQGKGTGSLYPQRRERVKDAKGKVKRTGPFLPNNGWVKFDPNKEELKDD